MGRALIIVLDSVGCGGAADAAAYGDEGADTLGHIAALLRRGQGRSRSATGRAACACPRSTRSASASRCALRAASSRPASPARRPRANGAMASRPRSGKDTPSGHWEIAGTPVDFDWGYFPQTIPAFPGVADRGADRGGRPAGHSRQSPRLGHGDHRRARRGASENAEADLLHLRRFGVPDRRARGGVRAGAALRALPDRAPPRAIRWRSGASSPGPSSARTPADFTRTAHRKDFSVPPLPGNLLERAARRRPRDRLDRQDRRHFRPLLHRHANRRARSTPKTST